MSGPYTPIDLSGNYSAIAPVVSHRNVGNPFWAVAGSGGGGGGSSSFSTLTASTINVSTIVADNSLAVGPNALSTAVAVIYGDADHKLKIESSGSNASIYHTNGAGTTDVPFLAYNGNTGYLSVAAPDGSVMMSMSSLVDGVTISTDLKVSSINGVQPTSKASYQVSTLTGSTTYVPANNVAWPLSGDIPTTPGHLYRISGVCAVNNGTSGNTSLLISGGGAGFPSAFASYQNAVAIPGNGGFAGGIQTTFIPASGTSVQVIAYNTDPTTSTTMDFYWPNWLVEDLGTGL